MHTSRECSNLNAWGRSLPDNASQKRNSELPVHPTNSIPPVSDKTGAGKKVSATKSLLLEKRNITQRSDGIFWSIYFNQRWPFRSKHNKSRIGKQYTYMLRAYVTRSIFSTAKLTQYSFFFRKTGHLRLSACLSELQPIWSNFTNSGRTGLVSFTSYSCAV